VEDVFQWITAPLAPEYTPLEEPTCTLPAPELHEPLMLPVVGSIVSPLDGTVTVKPVGRYAFTASQKDARAAAGTAAPTSQKKLV
jgi:hypothetical protein